MKAAFNAILTGSRAYGIPRPDSDWDVVILVDPSTFILLANLDPTPHDPDKSRLSESLSIKEGSLNLIVEKDPERFRVWQDGTNFLKAIRPVSREKAKEHFIKLEAAFEKGKNFPALMCVVCQVNPVCPEDGMDTCSYCTKAGA